MTTYGYAPYPDAATPQPNTTLLTVSGDFAAIEGKFKINDSLHVECEIGGELDVGGRLVIGEHGAVSADVRTVDALIMGRFQGNMIATGNVEIAANGRVLGSITTDSLVISKGGWFSGTVARIDEPRARDAALDAWREPAKQELVAVVVSEFRDRFEEVESPVKLPISTPHEVPAP